MPPPSPALPTLHFPTLGVSELPLSQDSSLHPPRCLLSCNTSSNQQPDVSHPWHSLVFILLLPVQFYLSEQPPCALWEPAPSRVPATWTLHTHTQAPVVAHLLPCLVWGLYLNSLSEGPKKHNRAVTFLPPLLTARLTQWFASPYLLAVWLRQKHKMLTNNRFHLTLKFSFMPVLFP